MEITDKQMGKRVVIVAYVLVALVIIAAIRSIVATPAPKPELIGGWDDDKIPAPTSPPKNSVLIGEWLQTHGAPEQAWLCWIDETGVVHALKLGKRARITEY